MCEHKIADYTFVLYNILFYDENLNNNNECQSLLCKRGKCICIDHEQTGLLRKLLSHEDQIVIPFDRNLPFSMNLQNHRENLCQQASLELYHNRFSPDYESLVDKMMEAYYVSNLCLLDVIKALPIQYATNSLHDFDTRNSLLYLCKYAPCSEKYLTILLRALICRTIGFCQRAITEEDKADYVMKLMEVLYRLKGILEQEDEALINQCIKAANTFIDNWELLQSDLCKALSKTILHELMDYLENLQSCTKGSWTNYESGRHYKLYCLLKKILESADISTTDFPELPFKDYSDSEDSRTEYDTVISILDQAKANTIKRAQIWSTLSAIFWGGEDIPTDDIDTMLHIINS